MSSEPLSRETWEELRSHGGTTESLRSVPTSLDATIAALARALRAESLAQQAAIVLARMGSDALPSDERSYTVLRERADEALAPLRELGWLDAPDGSHDGEEG